MKKHTTFRIGGPADYFVTVQSKDEIREILLLCKREQIPYYILGNGSNLLVGDKGYRGVVIQICKRMNEIRTEEIRSMRRREPVVKDCSTGTFKQSDRI